VTSGVQHVSLMRPSACTHSCDNEQRLIDVAFIAGAGRSITIQMPDNPNLAPPGWYLMFAVDHQGVPSIGQWLKLGGSARIRRSRPSAERPPAKVKKTPTKSGRGSTRRRRTS
jgi:hypothetical protein